MANLPVFIVGLELLHPCCPLITWVDLVLRNVYNFPCGRAHLVWILLAFSELCLILSQLHIQITSWFLPIFLALFKNFPCGSGGKASVYNVGDLGSIPGLGRFPWRRKWQSTPVLLPGKSHGQRSLVSYSTWGCIESDTTEQLHFTSSLNIVENLIQHYLIRRYNFQVP